MHPGFDSNNCLIVDYFEGRDRGTLSDLFMEGCPESIRQPAKPLNPDNLLAASIVPAPYYL